MKSKAFISTLGVALFLFALACGPSATAQVATKQRRSETTDQSYTNRGYVNGYNAGYNSGRRDAEGGQSYDPTRHPAYSKRDEGYDPSFGSRSEYQDNFVIGFEDGYQDGYQRLQKKAVTEGPTPLRYRAAFARGYQEGYDHGRKDAQNRTHYNFAHDKGYKSADLGYDARKFPSKEDYQFNFRKGYEAGYDDGYNNRPYSDRRDTRRTYTYRSKDEIRSSGQARRREREDQRYATGGTLVVPEGTTLRLELNNTLSTRSNQTGDPFTAQVIDPVYVRDALAIPAGSTVQGTVTRSARPGRVEGKAEMHLRFDSLTLPSDRTYKLNASVAGLESPRDKGRVGSEGTVTGPSSTKRDVGEIAIGTGIGALIGAIAGGGKGAAIGAGVGAGAGVVAVLVTRGHDVDLPQGTEMTIKLNRPLELRP